MSYYSAGREDRIGSQRLAFDRARAARRERASSWPSFSEDPAYKSNFRSSFDPFNNAFINSRPRYGMADRMQERMAEDWQKGLEKDEHKFALDAQAKGFKLQDETYQIAKKAQEDAQKRAQGQQRRRGFLGLASTAASFIPGVGGLISAGINAFGGML